MYICIYIHVVHVSMWNLHVHVPLKVRIYIVVLAGRQIKNEVP